MSILTDDQTELINRLAVNKYNKTHPKSCNLYERDMAGLRAVREAAYRETLKVVGEWLEEFHEEHSVNNVRYPRKDCDICIGRLKLGKLEVNNGH